MSSYSMSPEQRKDAFRRYLERYGIIDQLTKSFVALYEERNKPSNPLEYLKQQMSTGERDTVSQLQAEIARLQKENDELKAKLAERDEAK
ncbi:Associate of Myc 1 like protein [Aduncisulcus paluster]|uniref:Associate of Myc 1 like protein n=1 Tax=Aduncisulcus paluster TaxID=2918883 RepID=A0ABQ5JVT0_9EUKA|nr:Associate of Myc 1 like protein [Aduncisulcus paluster]